MVRDRFFVQKKAKKPIVDEEIESEESDGEKSDYHSCNDASDLSDKEDSNQKRLRLAKEYLDKLQRKEDDSMTGAKQEDHEIISARLKNDQLEQTGKLFRDIASKLSLDPEISPKVALKGHSKSITQAILTSNGKFIYTSAKDGCIIKWDATSFEKLHTFPRADKLDGKSSKKDNNHFDSVFALAVSSDSKFLASGGKDRKINIYSVESNALLKTFFHHKDFITGLVFRRGSNELFSSSMDRSVKLWNIEGMTYVETLFGHQEGILDVDSSVKERCISVGGRDRSLHLFKILDESQLVFRVDDGRFGSLNCCRMIDEDNFVCSSECGALIIFNSSKKKPIFILDNAHGDNSGICSLGKIILSNVIISGSASGNIRIWKVSVKKDSLSLLVEFQIKGFPNSISTSYDGSMLAIACGKEPKLGRWEKRSDFTNATFLFRLIK